MTTDKKEASKLANRKTESIHLSYPWSVSNCYLVFTNSSLVWQVETRAAGRSSDGLTFITLSDNTTRSGSRSRHSSGASSHSLATKSQTNSIHRSTRSNENQPRGAYRGGYRGNRRGGQNDRGRRPKSGHDSVKFTLNDMSRNDSLSRDIRRSISDLPLRCDSQSDSDPKPDSGISFTPDSQGDSAWTKVESKPRTGSIQKGRGYFLKPTNDRGESNGRSRGKGHQHLHSWGVVYRK